MTALRQAVPTHPAARPRDGDAVYALRNVSKAFGRGAIRALDHVDLTLERGTFSSIIGPSGCGKSTLLKIMAGLTPPSSGSVMLEGRPVTGPRRDIGMMFQQATLFPWRTTIENILLPIEVRDGKRAAAAARPSAEALLELVGLKGFGTAYPSELSGGMAQRAALARAVILSPDVILADEPTGALDVTTGEAVMALLDEAPTLADKVARGLRGRGDADHLVAKVLQHEAQLHRHQHFVFDDQNTRGHQQRDPVIGRNATLEQ